MSDFDWDEANIAHIRLHKVEPHEAEEALLNSIDLDAEIVGGEMMLVNVGASLRGQNFEDHHYRA